MRFAPKYNLWAVCFHAHGLVDPKDEPVSGSGVFDIEDSLTSILISWNSQFQSEVIGGFVGTNYALVLVPKDAKVDKFLTLRDALKGGAVILQGSTGPP